MVQLPVQVKVRPNLVFIWYQAQKSFLPSVIPTLMSSLKSVLPIWFGHVKGLLKSFLPCLVVLRAQLVIFCKGLCLSRWLNNVFVCSCSISLLRGLLVIFPNVFQHEVILPNMT